MAFVQDCYGVSFPPLGGDCYGTVPAPVVRRAGRGRWSCLGNVLVVVLVVTLVLILVVIVVTTVMQTCSSCPDKPGKKTKAGREHFDLVGAAGAGGLGLAPVQLTGSPPDACGVPSMIPTERQSGARIPYFAGFRPEIPMLDGLVLEDDREQKAFGNLWLGSSGAYAPMAPPTDDLLAGAGLGGTVGGGQADTGIGAVPDARLVQEMASNFKSPQQRLEESRQKLPEGTMASGALNLQDTKRTVSMVSRRIYVQPQVAKRFLQGADFIRGDPVPRHENTWGAFRARNSFDPDTFLQRGISQTVLGRSSPFAANPDTVVPEETALCHRDGLCSPLDKELAGLPQ